MNGWGIFAEIKAAWSDPRKAHCIAKRQNVPLYHPVSEGTSRKRRLAQRLAASRDSGLFACLDMRARHVWKQEYAQMQIRMHARA